METKNLAPIYFDLSSQERWARLEWESLLDRISGKSDARYFVTADPSSAKILVSTKGEPLTLSIREIIKHRDSPPWFVWDHSDFPTGLRAGLFCSLKRPLFSHTKHRSFCYPIIYNELIDFFALNEASYDWLFFGGITSSLRKKLIEILNPMVGTNGLIVVQGGPWNSMFDRSGIKAKVDYANSLKHAKFILCPRGNGVGSIRLFEVLKASRVPIIISDEYVLPSGIDWEHFSIVVPEKDIGLIPTIVSNNLYRWESMAKIARSVWCRHFSDSVLLNEIGDSLSSLQNETASVAYKAKMIREKAALTAKPMIGRLIRKAS